jgi:hypothetical protein
MKTPGSADWGTFKPDRDGVCVVCSRTVAWHAGTGCYSPTATGMPRPVPLSPHKEKESFVQEPSS